MIRCPVCSTPSGGPFLVRERVPVHQNLVVHDVQDARAMASGTLALHACEACGFVHNAAFDPRRLTYGPAYDNTQSCSPSFEAYVESLADRVAERTGPGGRRFVEVGCGKGAFLRTLLRRHPQNRAIGFDPSYVGPEVEAGGRLRFERRVYDQTSRSFAPDAVICRHVIEHIADPLALVRDVRESIAGAPARIFFETPCVEWILANEVIWDFFYEHCSYFTAASLRAAFERQGFAVDDVRHTFGGQYLWLEGRAGTVTPAPFDAGAVPRLARRFAEHEAQLIEEVRRRLESLRADGPVAMWGAAAKGVTLAGLADPDCRLIACVVDLNPNKHGAALPGTGHPIVSPAGLAARGIRTAVVTNPNYLDENRRLLRELGSSVRLVDLMQHNERNAHPH